MTGASDADLSDSSSGSSRLDCSASSTTLSEMSVDSEAASPAPCPAPAPGARDMAVQTDATELLGRGPYTSSLQCGPAPAPAPACLSYQDRVSLWVRGDRAEENNNTGHVVIVSREKVTLRINPGHQRRLSTSTLYEDIEEAGEWLSPDYLRSLRPAPPPLPPRQPAPAPGPRLLKRKNLNHLLGIDQQMDLNILRDNCANLAAIRNLQELGRVKSRKDLTKFLGINEAKLRKRSVGKKHADHRRSKSIIENIFNATKHFKSTKDNNNDQSCLSESLSHLDRDQDQGRSEEINLENAAEDKRDVTRAGEELDHLLTSHKIARGNENGKKDVANRDVLSDKSRTSSFSSVSSSRSSSSSQESLEEKSSFTKIFRNSSRRFSTSGIELMESLKRKSTFGKKYQSSLEDIPLESSLTDDSVYRDKSYIEEFIARGMPVIPFDQPLMALLDSKQEPHPKKSFKSRSDDYISVSDSLDTLIKLAKGELFQESTAAASPPVLSCGEEPIYIEMSKGTSSLSSEAKPNYSEYMDMDVVQSALSNFRFTS